MAKKIHRTRERMAQRVALVTKYRAQIGSLLELDDTAGQIRFVDTVVRKYLKYNPGNSSAGIWDGIRRQYNNLNLK